MTISAKTAVIASLLLFFNGCKLCLNNYNTNASHSFKTNQNYENKFEKYFLVSAVVQH